MTTFEERLFAKIMFDPADPDGCWVWVGATASGYGQIRRDGRLIQAHRATYELYVGSIPPGMSLDHLCHTRRCVRPDHLRIVTNKQNQEHRAGANKNSRSGVRGVSWNTRRGRWEVRVGHHGRYHFGGYFDDLDAAAEAARALRLKLFTHSDPDRVPSA